MPFFSLKNRYGHGLTGRTVAAGPERIVRAGCCPVVVAQWQSTGCTSQVSWVQILVIARPFHFPLFSPHNVLITGMCFGFLTNVPMQLTVHVCDMITHLKLR